MADRDVKSTTAQEPLPLRPRDASSLSMTELLGRIAVDVKELVKTEVALAKSEVQADLREEAKAAKGLGVAALLGYAAVVLLLVTVILALAEVLQAWAAGLIVSGVVLVAAGIFAALGWAKRVKTPMGRTRRQVKQTLEWAKGQVP